MSAADAAGGQRDGDGARPVARLAILDIGATLVTGPARGPAARIAEALGLDRAQKTALASALMTSPFAAPEEVATFARGLGCSAPEVGDSVATIWNAQRAEAEPLPGALDALQRLRDDGIALALISNIWEPYLRSVRVHYGAFFDAHIPHDLQLFSFREGSAKPATQLFERALARAGVGPADAVMIGDSYGEDIAPAIALGLQTTWVLHRPQREASNLIRILNGEAPPPSRTIGAIADLAVAARRDEADAAPRPPAPDHQGVPVARAVS
ncbi:HAD family hydrolase [Conexibacter sp. CPCC 206217]|uniref:HAD family hydrolase n=1 Tax=Conexibacter sp. CPCC 206217 TaxID=3064574 RepID=UPI002717D547|nr:HAD family hydrolase [Conexibacter sp. CPCC 206217]MDO8211191.1 HAD hydrolase-like protein [Conexibacter sp. CPCC 206217]